MRLVLRFVAGFVFVLTSLFAWAGTAEQTSLDLTLEEYRAELQRIETKLPDLKSDPGNVAAPLATSIVDKYRVTVDQRVFEIDNKSLKMAIGEYKIADASRRDALFTAIQNRLNMLDEELAGFSAPQTTNVRPKLEEVLARRDFRNAKGLTLVDAWKQKVRDWIARLLDKIFGSLPSRQSRNDTFAWILIAVALCFLAVWVKRRLGQKEAETIRIPVPFSPSEKNWRTWLAEARAAAAQNQWRDAVHLAYWAGISNLEESGAWIPDRARTPREYLQLISRSHPRHDDLLALTRGFELIWYGKREAELKDFSEALRHLEVLGCR